MKHVMITVRPLVYPLLSLLAVAVASQDSRENVARQRVLGEVHGRDGKPWVGVVVTLVGQSRASQIGLEAVDRIQVETRARGRFRARILPDRSYRAWAVHKTDDGPRFTKLLSGIEPGEAVELVEDETQPVAVTLELFGLDAWKGRGLRWFVDEHELTPDAKGRVAVPPSAGDSVWVEGRIGERVLLRHAVSIDPERRKAAKSSSTRTKQPIPGLPDLTKLPEPAADVERVLVPPPLVVSVRAVDKSSKKPIASARVLVRDERGAGTVFTGDADGRVQFEIAHPIDSFGAHSRRSQHTFFAWADGYALRRTGWKYQGGVEALSQDKIKDGKADELTVELERGFSFNGKVKGPEGFDPSGLRVLYELQTSESVGANSYRTVRVGAHEARVAADGTWKIAGLGKRYTRLDVYVPLPASLTAPLTKDRPVIPAMRRVPIAIKNLYQLDDDISATVDLGKLRAIDLELELEDGPKAGYASVTAMTNNARSPWDLEIGEELRTDRRGRCRVFVTGPDVMLVATTKTHYAIVRPGKTDQQKVKLERCARFSGRIVDRNGKPVEGASLRLTSITMGGGDPLHNFKLAFNQRALSGGSGEDGRFSLYWIPAQGMTLGVQAYYRRSGQASVQGGQVVLGMESIEDATLTLDVDTKAKDKGK